MPAKVIRPGVRSLVFARDGLVCQICFEDIPERKDVTFDHILPVCKGGKSTIENLRVACLPCNNARGDGTFSEEKFRKVREKIIRKLGRKAAIRSHRANVAGFNLALWAASQPQDPARYEIPEKYRTAVAHCQASRVASQTFEEKLAAQKQDEDRLSREMIAGGL